MFKAFSGIHLIVRLLMYPGSRIGHITYFRSILQQPAVWFHSLADRTWEVMNWTSLSYGDSVYPHWHRLMLLCCVGISEPGWGLLDSLLAAWGQSLLGAGNVAIIPEFPGLCFHCGSMAYKRLPVGGGSKGIIFPTSPSPATSQVRNLWTKAALHIEENREKHLQAP